MAIFEFDFVSPFLGGNEREHDPLAEMAYPLEGAPAGSSEGAFFSEVKGDADIVEIAALFSARPLADSPGDEAEGKEGFQVAVVKYGSACGALGVFTERVEGT